MARKAASSFNGTWRILSQNTGPKRRAMSPAARRRRFWQWMRAGAAFVSLLLLAGVAAGAYFWWQSGREVSLTLPSQPLHAVEVTSDGVLERGWVLRTADVPLGAPLMEVDIHAIKAALEAHGQVASATVERVFPDRLAITLRERVPVVRLRASGPGGERILLAAADGTVFEGHGYAALQLRALPFVAGVRLKKNDGGFEPLSGVPAVAALLERARADHPELYDTFRFVSCESFTGDFHAPGAALVVHTRTLGNVRFAPYGFSDQLDRLARTVRYLREDNRGRVLAIDLTLSGEAAVRFNGNQSNRLPTSTL